MRNTIVVCAAVVAAAWACGKGSSRAGVQPPDTGAAQPPPAGTTPADAGVSDPAGGQASGGRPDPGKPPSADTCTPSSPPACTAGLTMAAAGSCRAPLFPVEPLDPDLATPPTACDDRENWASGAFATHISTDFDGSGRPTASRVFDPQGAVIQSTSTTWDACGNALSSETRNATGVIASLGAAYGEDGLLRAKVTTSYGQCSSEHDGYTFDAQGRVETIYDPIACETTAKLSYDAAGRVAQVQRASSRTDYAWYPSGALKEVKFNSTYGYFFDHLYDDRGRPLSFHTNMTGGSTGDSLSRVWTYDVAGRLAEYSRVLDGISCRFSSTDTRYEYDAAGRLSRTAVTSSVMGGPCSILRYDTAVTLYSYPLPSVTVAEALDRAGAPALRTTTVVDAAGRAIRGTVAVAPDFVEQPVFARDYSCLAQ